ncbi:MAG: hypothetical protein HQL08_06840 [Nitrospirae bacterium]|nr:hypothetical protein [Nitrospirota bacterium]
MSVIIGNNLPNYNHQKAKIDPATEESRAPVSQPELSPAEDKVTISSALMSATINPILNGIASMSSQQLGQIYRLDAAKVGSLLAD